MNFDGSKKVAGALASAAVAAALMTGTPAFAEELEAEDLALDDALVVEAEPEVDDAVTAPETVVEVSAPEVVNEPTTIETTTPVAEVTETPVTTEAEPETEAVATDDAEKSDGVADLELPATTVRTMGNSSGMLMASNSAITDETSLRAALESVEDGDTLTLANSFTLSNSIVISNGKKFTISGSDSGFTISRAEGFTDRLFELVKGTDLTLTNITLQGSEDGTASIITMDSGAKLTLGDGAILTGNTLNTNKHIVDGDTVVWNGGAINAQANTTIILEDGCQVTNNSSKTVDGAGAIYLADTSASLIMNGGTISGNSTTASGGAIATRGVDLGIVVTLNGGSIVDNTACSGGAINISGNTLHVYGTDISGNKAVVSADGTAGCGGAIYASVNAKITLHDGAKVHDNSAERKGGAIYTNSSTTIIEAGAAVYNNTADLDGGGVWLSGSSVTNKGYIYGNSAKNGGGVYCNGGAAHFYNTAGYIGAYKDADGNLIAAANTATNGGGVYVASKGTFQNGVSGAATQGYVISNTATSNGGGVYVAQNGNFTNWSSSGAICENTAVNGGGIYLVKPTASRVSVSGWVYNNTASENGGGVYVDGGTFDYYATSYLNTAKNGGGIYAANATVNNYGWVGTYGKDSDGNDISYGNKATSNGGGVYLDASKLNNKQWGTLDHNEATSNGGGIYATNKSTVTLDGSSYIQSCKAGANGGGMYLTGDGTTATNNGGLILFNSANNGGGVFVYGGASYAQESGYIQSNKATYYGGGIDVDRATADLKGGEVSSNKAGYGAGACVESAIDGSVESVLYINGATISNNKATSWGGGVMTIERGTAIMNSGSIKGNTATQGGGVSCNSVSNRTADRNGNYNLGGRFIMNGGSITGNTATYNGGGVFVAGYNYGNNETELGGGGLFVMNDGEISGNKIDLKKSRDPVGDQIYVFGGMASYSRYEHLDYPADVVAILGGTISGTSKGASPYGAIYVGEHTRGAFYLDASNATIDCSVYLAYTFLGNGYVRLVGGSNDQTITVYTGFTYNGKDTNYNGRLIAAPETFSWTWTDTYDDNKTYSYNVGLDDASSYVDLFTHGGHAKKDDGGQRDIVVDSDGKGTLKRDQRSEHTNDYTGVELDHSTVTGCYTSKNLILYAYQVQFDMNTPDGETAKDMLEAGETYDLTTQNPGAASIGTDADGKSAIGDYLGSTGYYADSVYPSDIAESSYFPYELKSGEEIGSSAGFPGSKAVDYFYEVDEETWEETYTDYTPLANPQLVSGNYTFLGWALDKDGDQMVDGSYKMTKADLTLYAIWGFSIEQHSNYGSDELVSDIDDVKSSTAPNKADGYESSATRSGYTFDGWYFDADCTVKYDESDEDTWRKYLSDGTLKLYAKWTQDETNTPADDDDEEATPNTPTTTTDDDDDDTPTTPAATVTDDATPAAPAAPADDAPAEEAIADDETPEAAPAAEIPTPATPLTTVAEHLADPECWVHKFIFLGGLITLIYGAIGGARRRKDIEGMQDFEDGLKA